MSNSAPYTADAVVISCFDARIRFARDEFLRRNGIAQPDLVVIAGGSLVLSSPRTAFDRAFVLEQVQLAIRLHRASRAILMSHSDCATYGGLAAFNGDRSSEMKHLELRLDDGKQNVAPLQIGFNSDDMPTRKPTGLGPPAPFVLLTQRQPSSEPWNPLDEPGPRPSPLGSHWIFEAHVSHKAALDKWNKDVADPVIEGLEVVQQGRPVSLIPSFVSLEAGTPVWQARMSIIDLNLQPQMDDDKIVVRFPGDTPQQGEVSVIGRSLHPETLLRVGATWRGLLSTESQPLQGEMGLGPLAREPETDLPPEFGFFFEGTQWQPQVDPNADPHQLVPQIVRMGALDLLFLPARRKSGADPSPIPNLPSESQFRAVFTSDPTRGVIDREVSYSLAVGRIRPGGQDEVPGDEFSSDLGATTASTEEYRDGFRRRPSLLMLPPGTQPAKVDPNAVPFFLTVQEQIPPGSSQTVTLRLRRNTAVGAAEEILEVVVLDPQPFLVTKVAVPNFERDLSLGITDEIGNWTNRADSGVGWELSAGATGFQLILPPQGMGEAMHRYKGDGDIVPGTPIDFRFTPVTRVELQPSFFRQRFAEAPWNLRRILGYPGQRSPGAGVTGIEFELLYGVHGQLTYPFLRLAESASRLGQLAGQQPPNLPWRSSVEQCLQYQGVRNLWRNLYPALLSRLAVLEPYDTDRPGQLVVTDPDGLSFVLRDNDKDNKFQNAAHLRYPVIGSEPQPAENSIIPNFPDGVPGSYAWGFESNNIYHAIWRNPKSTAAQLTRPLFSSYGGWAHQKASFDRGLTTIYSDVTMGRLSSLNIERIGRINTFWNRAKHVIVYERTVAASRQFFLDQEPLTGNCVLRKVDEYVELLEEERQFPEFGTAATTRGFLRACRFTGGKPPRIRVNSRWGGDVGTTGWKVPLWVRGAAPADVYPKPAVHVLLAGAQPGELLPFAIDEPDKLYFYTDTNEDSGNNPDLWPAVEGVDYSVIDGDMITGLQQPGPGSSTDLNQFAVRVPPVPVGSGMFTLALVPGGKPVNLVAERATEAIAAAVHNVTVMRAIAADPTPASDPGDFAKVRALRDHLSNAFAGAMSELTTENLPLDPNQLQSISDAAKEKVDDLQQKALALHAILTGASEKGFENALCAELKRRVGAQLDFLVLQIRHELESLLLRMREDFKGEVALLRAMFPDPKAAKQQLHAVLDALLDGPEGGGGGYRDLVQMVRGGPGEVIGLLDDTLDSIERSAETLRIQLRDSQCEICKLVTNPDDPLPQTEAELILEGARAAVEECLREIDYLLAEAVRPWVGDRMDNVRIQLHLPDSTGVGVRRAIENLARAMRYAIRDPKGLRRDVALKFLQDLIASIIALKDVVTQLVDANWRSAIEGLHFDALANVLESYAALFSNLIDSELTDWDAFLSKIDSPDSAIRQFLATLPDLVAQKLAELRQQAQDAAGDLCHALFPKLDDLAKLLGVLFDPKLVEDLKAILKDIAPTLAQFREELERMYTQMLQGLSEFVNRALATIPRPPLPAFNFDNTLRLIRSFGKPPELPGLEFTVPDCGHYFFDFSNLKKLGVPIELPSVNLTPSLAEVNKLLPGILNPFQISLPTVDILDRLKPFNLQTFDLSGIFPKFAGLDLSNLFANLRLPTLANVHVKVTHGVDPQTRSGWLQVDVDVPIDQPATVFAVAGITLRLVTARFRATSRIDATVGQPPRRTLSGNISGDWDLQVGGFPIAVLTNCTLLFEDGGHIRFDVSPDRVRLQQVLAFLADLMSKFGFSDKGFSVVVSPTGVQSVLDLPLPDIQAGAFGLANLRLGFSFGLRIVPKFTIDTTLSVGSRRAPFTLVVFILGGAGWLELGLSYTPGGEFTTTVSIAIFAAASLAIALGPIKGGVYAYFGITVEYGGSSNGSSSLVVGLLLLFRGEVSLLGIVSVSLALSLEAQYSSGGGLVGRGQVSYSIKICWFVTINVNAQIEYHFGGSSGGGRLQEFQDAAFLTGANKMGIENSGPADYGTVAAQYIDMFAD